MLCASGCSQPATDSKKKTEPKHSTDSESLGLWYGPGSLNTVTRGIRDDFIEQVTNSENWPSVYAHTAVFKQFIESLAGDKYSDEELRKLASFLREAGIECAFEIGALRWSKDLYGPSSGEKYAAGELEALQRWVDAGGTVDYLTTDHAVMWNVGLVLQGAKPMEGLGDPDWRLVLEEVADSLALMQKHFPDARIGMIESLGYFSVGDTYRTTDPGSLYPVDFEEFVRISQERLREHGVELDHLHVDFSLHDCRYDGRHQDFADYGRILAAEAIIKAAGLDSGIIINAFDDYSFKGTNIVQEERRADNAEERSESAVVNTLEYFDGYLAAGGAPDVWILQRWQPYPDVTGPESVRHSDMGIARLLIERMQAFKPPMQ
jgi:hypothetical protein